jgi:hypothetical protein
MINYTDALTAVVADIVERVEALSFIETSRLLLFARVGRTGANGAYATCHCLNLPDSEPGYFYWRSRSTGEMTRRTEWFVTRTPEVRIGRRRLDYLLSFTLPRFCDQDFDGARKAEHYRGCEPWVAKLDTIVHELYHISPRSTGLRKFERADGGSFSNRSHGPHFLEDVASFVRTYIDSRPDPKRLEFLKCDFEGLNRRYGTVTGTTFRNFPSYPQRYPHVVRRQPAFPALPVVAVPRSSQPPRYTEADLQVRAFTDRGAGRVVIRSLTSAA